MTCKEKYEEMFGQALESVKLYCPDDFKIMHEPPQEWCTHKLCEECWSRGVPEEDAAVAAMKGLSIGINDVIPEIVEAAATLAKNASSIKDSGSTTEFDTGAHRDAREGKGRCDLLPLEVVGNYITDDNETTDWVLWCIRKFQETQSTSYLYSALKNFEEIHWKNPYTMFLEVAKHYEAGALKYGADNWRRGMPVYIYIDSAVRHYLKWLRGDTDESHDRAFVWNLMCCIWEVDYHKEGTK